MSAQDAGAASTALAASLDGFIRRVDGLPRLRSVLKGWTPTMFIEGRDTQERYRLEFSPGQPTRFYPTGELPDDDALLLRGAAGTLVDVFEGVLSPLRAHSDGLIEVYGSDRDQIKLDTIALIVWGA